MDEMFKGQIKHTIQKFKDEINGVDNVSWHVANAYFSIIETDAMFASDVLAEECRLVEFLSNEKAKLCYAMNGIKSSEFLKILSEIEKLIE